jgi:hypothetical protein
MQDIGKTVTLENKWRTNEGGGLLPSSQREAEYLNYLI